MARLRASPLERGRRTNTRPLGNGHSVSDTEGETEMTHLVRRHLLFALAILAVAVLTAAFASTSEATGSHVPEHNPIIFVHGGAGSGAQFESQAMRFTSRGYDADEIHVLEYDSSNPAYYFGANPPIRAQLDALIADALADSDADQVDLLGHSLGTFVSQGYLNSDPARAALVEHYVNIDGAQALAPPGGVETLAIWAGTGTPGRQIVGAENVTLPGQSHVQSATSAEAFAAMYEFFTGEEPNTTHILPTLFVQLEGRAVIFPENEGVQDATLEVWRVRSQNGHRIGHNPVATFALNGDGSFGPFWGSSLFHYEFAIVRDGAPTHHLYYDRFVRSDHLIRLNTSLPGEGLGANVEPGDNHASATVVRYKEMWGDQGASNDILEINGENVLNAATSPASNSTNAMFAYDVGSDGVTDLSAPIPVFFAAPFISGVDVFMPAETPPKGKITFEMEHRDSGGLTDRINTPNWASTTDRMTIQFNDYAQKCSLLTWWWCFVD